MEVVEILKKAIDQNASDIFFVAGSPCMFKVGQQLVKVTQEKMMPNDTKDIVQQLYGFAPYCSYENFVANGEDDFLFFIPGWSFPCECVSSKKLRSCCIACG